MKSQLVLGPSPRTINPCKSPLLTNVEFYLITKIILPSCERKPILNKRKRSIWTYFWFCYFSYF